MKIPFTWKKDYTLILLAFITLRVIYSVVGAQVIAQGEPEALGADASLFQEAYVLADDPVSKQLVNIWMRWDTTFYIKIAALGYASDDGSIAFMPLYPWLMRSLGWILGGNLLLSGLIISNLAAFISLLLLYELVTREKHYPANPVQTIIALLLFPTAFFLLAGYTESLFLMLLLIAWLSALKGKWLLSGLAATLATLCRVQGLLLVPMMLWIHFLSASNSTDLAPREQLRTFWNFITRKETNRKIDGDGKFKVIVADALPVVAFLTYYVLMNKAGMGNFSLALEKYWGIQTVAPWTGLWLFLERLLQTQRVFIDYIDLLALALIVAISIYTSTRFNSAYSLFIWLNLALFFMRGTPPHLLDSFSRYMLLLFPVFFFFGRIQDKKVLIPLALFSFCLQLFLLLGFLSWKWVA